MFALHSPTELDVAHLRTALTAGLVQPDLTHTALPKLEISAENFPWSFMNTWLLPSWSVDPVSNLSSDEKMTV